MSYLGDLRGSRMETLSRLVFQIWRWICSYARLPLSARLTPPENCGHDCQHAVDLRRRILSRCGRVEENKCIRDLFRKTAPVINDPTLRVRMQELAATGDNDYFVSCS
jgi:hypothetical protein